MPAAESRPRSPVVTTIKKASGIELSLVIMICGGIAAGAVWATKMSLGQKGLTEDVGEIRQILRDGVADRWRGRDMHSWVIQANREAEVWARAAEQAMDLPPGTWRRFEFPDPHEIQGTPR